MLNSTPIPGKTRVQLVRDILHFLTPKFKKGMRGLIVNISQDARGNPWYWVEMDGHDGDRTSFSEEDLELEAPDITPIREAWAELRSFITIGYDTITIREGALVRATKLIIDLDNALGITSPELDQGDPDDLASHPHFDHMGD